MPDPKTIIEEVIREEAELNAADPVIVSLLMRVRNKICYRLAEAAEAEGIQDSDS